MRSAAIEVSAHSRMETRLLWMMPAVSGGRGGKTAGGESADDHAGPARRADQVVRPPAADPIREETPRQGPAAWPPVARRAGRPAACRSLTETHAAVGSQPFRDHFADQDQGDAGQHEDQRGGDVDDQTAEARHGAAATPLLRPASHMPPEPPGSATRPATRSCRRRSPAPPGPSSARLAAGGWWCRCRRWPTALVSRPRPGRATGRAGMPRSRGASGAVGTSTSAGEKPPDLVARRAQRQQDADLMPALGHADGEGGPADQEHAATSEGHTRRRWRTLSFITSIKLCGG